MEAWGRLAAVLIAATACSCASLQKILVGGQDPITLAEAIDAYNQAPEVTAVFRLYGADPEATLDTATITGLLLFIIKETVCPKEAEIQSGDKCHFKDKGNRAEKDCRMIFPLGARGDVDQMVKDCSVSTLEKHGNKTFVVTCETVTANAPVRRPRQVRQCTTVNNRQRCRIVRPSVNTSLNVGNREI